MTVTINGSGTITGVSTMGTTVVNQTLTTPTITSTMGVGNATPSASGAGITFPATQSASTDANTLDDYEEGTFTPTIYGSSAAGTTTYTGSTYGRYVKIGQWVFIELSVYWSSSTGASGSLLVGNLPFAPSNFTNHYPTASIGYYNYGSNTGWGNIFQAALVSPNSTVINVYYSGSTTMTTVNAASVLNSGGGNIYISTKYLAA